MKFDIFLYGRTKTYDYTDMYMPVWLQEDKDAYSEYRRMITHIFKIREILSERDAAVLEHTRNSYVFLCGRDISLLCRCCHVSGTDEFGRKIFSTEGFITQNTVLKKFWAYIPAMISWLESDENDFYDEYISFAGDSKPQVISKEEFIGFEYDAPEKYSEIFSLLNSLSSPVSFAVGDKNRELYCYTPSKDVPEINHCFLTNSENSIPAELLYSKKYLVVRTDRESKKYHIYLDIRKSEQSRLRYRLVVGDNSVEDVPFTGYEIEEGQQIRMASVRKMYKTISEYIEKEGYSQISEYLFERW